MTGAEVAAAGKAAKVVGEKVLGEDEKTKDVLLRRAEGTAEMAAAARTMAARTAVLERIKLKILEPIGRLFGVGSDYFADTFPEEMAAKLASVPAENIVTPSSSVAGPTILALSYTYDEPSLKEMYLNLLAAASDDRRASRAHPAFAEIIKQLAPEEARELSAMFTFPRDLPVARAKDALADPPGAYRILQAHLLPVAGAEGKPREEPQLPTWLDNWARLGLVNITYTEYSSGPNSYDWVKTRPEYIRLAEKPGITRLDFDKGIIRLTDFGRQFLSVIR
jgi:Abortive infection alpha